MEYIATKLKNSGFHAREIQSAKQKALRLDRDEILTSDRRKTAKETNSTKQLTFMINRSGFMCTEIKRILKDCKPDIDRLLGEDTRVILAERKNSSIGSCVFAKSSFSENAMEMKEDQKCNGRGCKLCGIMNLENNVVLWKSSETYKKTVKLDYRRDCSTDCAIYLYVCNNCVDNDSFYIGQTINSCQTRANGHRGCFNPSSYEKSALSLHIYEDHPQHINRKLSNYNVGVIKSVNAANLDRAEDYYVENYNANLSLNRYKVTS